MSASRRATVVISIALGVAGTSMSPAFAERTVDEPGFVSVNAGCDGTAHALLSHFVDGGVGAPTSQFATSGPGVVSDLITGWAHRHGDQVSCVGPE